MGNVVTAPNPVHLRTLQAVLSTGSFADAGRELGYSASAMSQQIAALERATSLTLFERRAHGVSPTSAAYRLAELARPALAALGDLADQLGDLADGRAGVLRVGTFPSAGPRILPSALAEIVRSHPAAEVHLEEAEPEDTLPQVANGSLDLALVYEYELARREWPAGVTTNVLLSEELILLLPRAHLLAANGDPGLSDLADEIWIASREGTAGSRSLEQLCSSAGFAPRIAHRSNDYDLVHAMVQAGLGVAVVPALAHRPGGGLRSVILDNPHAHRRALLAHRPENSNPLLPEALAAVHRAAGRWRRADHALG